MGTRLGFRHCDPRWGFLWLSQAQPAARWHGTGEGPANYFADTPTGAWAEFLRHEGITDVADLAGIQRSLWAVELPDDGYSPLTLSDDDMRLGRAAYPACQAQARALRQAGAQRLQAASAALLPGGASGSQAMPTGLQPATPARDGLVWVLYGELQARGWQVVEGGAPPAAVLPLVRHLPTAP